MWSCSNVALFVISCILLLASIIVFILVLALPPVQKTNPPINPVFPPLLKDPAGFEQSFIQTPSGGFVLDAENSEDGAKPFVITVTKDGPIKNAILFSNLTPIGQPNLTVETVNTSRGFVFGVKKQTSVVALQVVDELFVVNAQQNHTRSVAIFNVDSGLVVVQNSVDKTTDPLVQGFRTHALLLSEQAILLPGVKYACVSVVNPGDFYSTSQFVASPPQEVMIGSTQEQTQNGYGWTGFVPSNFVALPTNFTSSALPIVFASFQLQEKNVPFTRTFEVDNLYARFPPRYIYNLNVSVKNENFAQVYVTDGLCNSAYNDINLVLPEATIVTPSNGETLNMNSWYAVYLAAKKTDFNGNNATVYVSANINELPNDNDNNNVGLEEDTRMRRIGWVRTKPNSATNFYSFIQSGDGIRRQTFYQEPVPVLTQNFVDGQTEILILSQIPPTSTEVVLQVEVTFEGPFLPSVLELKINNVQRVTLQGEQLYQIRSIAIPLTSTTIPFQIPVTVQMPAFGGTGNFQFNVLQFADDV